MPTIGQLTRVKHVDAVVDLGDGDQFKVTFDRNKITPAWVDAADRQAKEQQDVLALSSALAEVIVSWDVTADDGSEFPPNRENIGALSYGVQGELVAALIEASAPSRAEGEGSSPLSASPSTDSAPESLAFPNGSETSPSPTVSASPSPT
jgi:hypothetical protein